MEDGAKCLIISKYNYTKNLSKKQQKKTVSARHVLNFSRMIPFLYERNTPKKPVFRWQKISKGTVSLGQRKSEMSITALMLFFLCREASNETGRFRGEGI